MRGLGDAATCFSPLKHCGERDRGLEKARSPDHPEATLAPAELRTQGHHPQGSQTGLVKWARGLGSQRQSSWEQQGKGKWDK